MLRNQGLFAEQGLFVHESEIRAQLKSALDRLLPQSVNIIFATAAQDYSRGSAETVDFDHGAKESYSNKFINTLSRGRQKKARQKMIWDRISHLVFAKTQFDIYIEFNEMTTNVDAKAILVRLFTEKELHDKQSFKFAVVNRLIDCYKLTLDGEKISAQTDSQAAYLIDLLSQELGIRSHTLVDVPEKITAKQETEYDTIFRL